MPTRAEAGVRLCNDQSGLQPPSNGIPAFANRLAESLAFLSPEDIAALDALLQEAAARAETAERARRRQR